MISQRKLDSSAKIKVLVLALGVIFTAAWLLFSISDVDASAPGDPCGDVTLVWARGSGQDPNEREATKYFESVEARLGPGIQVTRYELGTETLDGARYNAVGVLGSWQSYMNLIEADASWTGFLGGEYRASVSRGVTELKAYLNQRSAHCSGEVFAVGGYSQGAQVVGEGLFGLSPTVRSRIAFVSLFGDPKLYLPEGRGVLPPACRGKQFSPWRRGNVSCWTDNGVLEARSPYLPSDIEDRTGSWCDRDDTVCNNNLFDGADAHGGYADEGAEMDQAAREIASALRERLPEKADEIDVSIYVFGLGTAGLDVAFVIDTTGSMSGSIGAARAIAESVGDGIVALRGRVALTEYRDAGDGVVSQIVVPLTTDTESFHTGLDTLFATGGGDTPEALLHALMTTLNGLDWKEGATKSAVVLTDAGYHDPDLAGGYTLADVVQRALEIDPVNVFPVVPSYASEMYETLAEQTAGRVFVDEGDTEAALLEAVGEIESRPVALLALTDYVASPGEEIVFDASASYDPDSELTSFEWDFDGDGAIDEETAGPTVAHTYPSPYDGLVEVRVNSADGGVANAVANVWVDEGGLDAALLQPPLGLTATSQPESESSRKVHLQWQPGHEDEEINSWLVMNEAGEAIGRTNGTSSSIDISGVPQRQVSFSVAAANQYGTGPPASVTVPADPPPASEQPPEPVVPQAQSKGMVRNLVALSLSRRRFLAAPAGPSILVRRQQRGFGTAVRFRLAQNGKVVFTVMFKKREVGRFSAAGSAGSNRVRFSGRIGHRRLKPGTYVLVARAGNAQSADSRSTTFVVLPPPDASGKR
ncbi:MAG TPA: cutinase family protein [Solirubrobacterales bacterium]